MVLFVFLCSFQVGAYNWAWEDYVGYNIFIQGKEVLACSLSHWMIAVYHEGGQVAAWGPTHYSMQHTEPHLKINMTCVNHTEEKSNKLKHKDSFGKS